MSCEHSHDDGAYVLGALSPAERDRFEKHLAGCAECRVAVANLAVLPGLLGRLRLEDVAQAEVPEQRLPRLAHRIAQSRRKDRLRVIGIGLVTACVMLFAGLAAGSARQPAPPPPQMQTMLPIAAINVSAEVLLTQVPGGTEVRMRCSYGENAGHTKPYVFRLVALGPNDVSEQVGSWTAAPGDEVSVTGTVRWTIEDLVRLEIRGKDGRPLLIYDVP